MKLQLKLLLIFSGASFILFTGFKSADLRDAQALQASNKPSPVSITASFTGGVFPSWTGTFTASGAIETSGKVTMDIDPNVNGIRAHFVLTLESSNGTITINQNCQFSTSPPKGNWKIVSGTGAYADLKGNGKFVFLPYAEAMEGDIN
jgi:Protein of unknown function (DUF3224)